MALDLALQCAPDHPWVTEHPEWFTTRADGTIAYAENPPKKYQDIYPLNFDNDPEGIRAEVLRVVLHWVGGAPDLPGGQPAHQAAGLLAVADRRGEDVDPDVLFLAEAFTRPAMMHGLGKSASRSRTRTSPGAPRWEIEEYCGSCRGGRLHAAELLAQHPGHPARVPAARRPADVQDPGGAGRMLSPSWGMYAGFELFEHVARPGGEEYLDKEKYQFRPRDWAGAEAQGRSLAPYLAALNRSAGRTRPCTGCATCASTRSTSDAALLLQARPGDRQHGPRDLHVRPANGQ